MQCAYIISKHISIIGISINISIIISVQERSLSLS